MYKFVYILILLASVSYAKRVSKECPGILIVSFDGFRHDYANKINTPFIEKQKAKARYGTLKPVFPSKTFPNHHSIATGLYPEQHGVLTNHVFDPMYNKILNYSLELYSFKRDVIPIWTLNQMKRQQHSGVMMWPGSEFPYSEKNIVPTFIQSYNTSWAWELKVDTAINWFVHAETPANLVMIYIEDPDSHAHVFGGDSAEVYQTIKKIDSLTEYIVKKLKLLDLSDKVNVFLLSDHGMSSTDENHIIDITKFSDPTKYLIVGTSPILHIFPYEGYHQKVYDDLLKGSRSHKMTVYNSNTLPEKWRCWRTRRSPTIWLVADEGYAFQDLHEKMQKYVKKWNITHTKEHTYGLHGYDPDLVENMNSFFMFWGPDMEKNVHYKKPVLNTALYATWANLLKCASPR